MTPPRRTSRGAQNRLTACPACASKLIYPIDLAGGSRDIVVSRRCPECEHRDVVVTARLPALIWFARNARQRDELAALCDAIADGLLVEIELASPSQAGKHETRAAEPDQASPLRRSWPRRPQG